MQIQIHICVLYMQGPCLEFLLRHRILDTLYTPCKNDVSLHTRTHTHTHTHTHSHTHTHTHTHVNTFMIICLPVHTAHELTMRMGGPTFLPPLTV